MAITPLWIDSFGHGRIATGAGGIYGAITGAAVTVTSPLYSGHRSLEVTAAGSAERVSYSSLTGTITTQAFAVRFAALPTQNIDDLASYTNTGGNGQVGFNNASDRFHVAISNTNNQDFGPDPIAVDTWYLIVMEQDSSTGTTTVRAKCYSATGTLIGEGSASRAQTGAANTAATLGTQNALTITAYYSSWVVSETNGDYEQWPVPWSVEDLIVNADGTHNITSSGDMDSFTGTAFSNATTTGNTFIDHRPLQAANTADNVIRQDLQSATTYMELLFENLPAGTSHVLSVRAYAAHVMSSTTGTPTAEARLMLSDSTEVLKTGSTSIIQSGEDPGTTMTIRKPMTIPPTGGWSRNLVDGAKVRIGFNNIAADVNFIDLMLDVLLVPASLVYRPTSQATVMLRR